jgi:CheY-like chemotaxis protein
MARVLIAEDDDDLAAQMTLVLQTAGHVVLVCSNGKDTLAHLPFYSPDLLILDMRMAYTLDGLDTLRHVRHDPSNARLPVLIISGLQDIADGIREKAAQLHCVEWLEKPFDIQQLLESVQRLARP